MSKEQHDNEKLIRWINKAMSSDELKELKNDSDFKRYKVILDEVDSWTLPELNIEKSYQKLKSYQKQSEVKVIPFYRATAFRVAAAFLILAVAFIVIFNFTNSLVTFETGIAETLEIKLPDGSTVSLAPSSTLSYDKNTWENSRNLKLNGSAFFEVTKGKQFEVLFELGKVAVLGTAFEVKSYEGFASVMCYEGKVSVKSGGNSSLLTKGKGLKINHERNVEQFDFENSIWSADRIRFHSAPLSVVFTTMERQFDIVVKTNNIDINRLFTGIYTNSNVDTALKMVCDPMGITYEKKGKTVTLQ